MHQLNHTHLHDLAYKLILKLKKNNHGTMIHIQMALGILHMTWEIL